MQDAVGLGGSGGLGLGFGGPVPGGGGGETGESPFNNLRDLFCHSAHLTVFLNYVMNSADPASLVSRLLNRKRYIGMMKKTSFFREAFGNMTYLYSKSAHCMRRCVQIKSGLNDIRTVVQ